VKPESEMSEADIRAENRQGFVFIFGSAMLVLSMVLLI